MKHKRPGNNKKQCILNRFQNQLPLFCICAVFVLAVSCDILRNGAFEVAAWSPGEGYHDPASIQVTLDFTGEPDRNSVEKSFSLAEDGTILAGHFSWQGSLMIFNSTAPFIPNRDYHITLKTGAQDTKGLSLERQFEAAFTTRDGRGRPMLLSSIPPDGGIMPGERSTVELVFSQPVTRSSLQNLSFTPVISGVWSLEDNGRRTVFTPSENWITGRDYRLTASQNIQNYLELDAGRSYILHFSAGYDCTRPGLLSAKALDSTGNTAFVLAEENALTENAGWERTHRLALEFSEAVDITSVTNALGIEPSLGMMPETAAGYAETVVYRFTDPPVWDGAYTITLNTTVKDRAGNTPEKRIRWRIRADGPSSKPPLLKGLRIPSIPGSNTDLLCYAPEDHFADFPVKGEHYTFDKGINTWMELYFDTASGASGNAAASIDSFSLMEKFRVSSTNGALSFSPRSIVLSGFTLSNPAPGWEHLRRVEIRGVMTNHPSTGMVIIETGAGLKDSLGNKSAEVQRFLLLK